MKKKNSIGTILDWVLCESNITKEEFVSDTRMQKIFFARMAYTRIRRDMGAKVVEIGKELNRNHSSVTRMLKNHNTDIKYTPYYRDLFQRIIRHLSTPCDCELL